MATMEQARTNGHATTEVQIESPLDVVETFIRRYLAITDDQATALTLWVIHTHAFDAAETTPYIRVTSIEPGSGKTRVLEVLEVLCAGAWFTGRVTGPAVAIKISKDRPTLLLDESDALFSGGAKSQEMLRGVLNSGYHEGGKVAVVRGRTVQEYDVYCPKAFAGLGQLPHTVMDRSIPIVMRKRTALDKMERMRRREVKHEAQVPRMLAARFGASNLAWLTDARPKIPDILDDRASDVWEPLLAIADRAGGEWPKRARQAAVNLCADRQQSNTDGLAFRLLEDITEMFRQFGTDRLKTVTILETLQASDIWADLDGRPLDARILSDNLKPFGISPMKIRFGRTDSLQGYMAYQFETAWKMVAPAPEVVLES